MTVGQVAEWCGVSPSALRFYEQQGLIESHRTGGNQRRYSREALRRVALVTAATRVGIPLPVVRDVLSRLPTGRTPDEEAWAEVTRQWHALLTRRIDELTALRDGVADCIGCACADLTDCRLAGSRARAGSWA
ncbi:redox-sensitive transcriptional activator SoxR [Streptomyces monticola]|uniref:Redox-sensitive transcriptional activator SoxR n=1 Tax=Streptomyces monticola TaxID=2666263 RepID=A0ABW2JTS2_9ACTN